MIPHFLVFIYRWRWHSFTLQGAFLKCCLYADNFWVIHGTLDMILRKDFGDHHWDTVYPTIDSILLLWRSNEMYQQVFPGSLGKKARFLQSLGLLAISLLGDIRHHVVYLALCFWIIWPSFLIMVFIHTLICTSEFGCMEIWKEFSRWYTALFSKTSKRERENLTTICRSKR